jgi:hypothetical protein
MNAETPAVTANTIAAEAAIRVTAARLNLDLCRSRVAALDQVRAGACGRGRDSRKGSEYGYDADRRVDRRKHAGLGQSRL